MPIGAPALGFDTASAAALTTQPALSPRRASRHMAGAAGHVRATKQRIETSVARRCGITSATRH